MHAGSLAENLTQFESMALNGRLNLADGHARQDLTMGQQRIVESLPELWAEATKRPAQEIEREAQRAYFELLGQHSAPDRVLSCYSSSVAMEILARSVATVTGSVALIHPTFDNIPDILRGVGLALKPVEEGALHRGEVDPELLRSVGCVFVTTPNNPTGRVVSEACLRRLAAQCAEHDVVLTLDTSFRGFDPSAHYDHYAVLRESGCRWVVIEDTGKLWPSLELKVGWLVSSENAGLPLATIHSDILLGVSPLVLLLVRRLAEDAAAGGLADLHALIGTNRAKLRQVLGDVPDVSFPDEESVTSVERVHIGQRSALDVWSALSDDEVYVLPCQKFHWADPDQGRHWVRVALARPTAAVEAAAWKFRAALVDGR